MGSTPTYKDLDALIEQATSRSVKSDGTETQTRIYCAKYTVCLDGLKGKYTSGTDDLTGYIIKESSVTQQRGGIGTLTDVWIAGGPDAGGGDDPPVTPLPPDTFSLKSQDLNPATEKYEYFNTMVNDGTRYNAAGATGSTDSFKTLLQWVREASYTTDPATATPAWNTLRRFDDTIGGSGTKFFQAVQLAWLLRRGVQNFYKASFIYQWVQFFYAMPPISIGGTTETPIGPAADAITALSLKCLRQADELTYDGQFYQKTSSWICVKDGNDTFWEPIIYAP